MPDISQESPDRLDTWAAQKWPAVVLRTGLVVFWLACVDSWWLPIEAIFIGPAIMVAGVAMTVWNKQE